MLASYSRVDTTPLYVLFVLVTSVALPQIDVPTYHNDNARTGQYLAETVLTPFNVKPGSFGRRFSHVVDGAVYAQPLYMRRVKINGKGLHNVVFVATAHDSLYAFDADDASGSNADPLWHVSFVDPSRGISPVPFEDVNCGVIQPELGIVGTPVLDAQAGTMYLVAQTKEPGNQYVFRLHAVDVTNGTERPGSPVVIAPPGFVPSAHKQRAALLLANGIVYSAWSSHCDLGLYHGWILGHDAATLSLRTVFNCTPNGNGGSFWNGGAGPAADSKGDLYVVASNGDFDADTGGNNYGNTVLRLKPDAAKPVVTFFTPFNFDTLNFYDLDLGSSGALLLPDEVGNPAHPHLLFTGGKEGRLYLLDRDRMGGAQVNSDANALASIPFSTNALLGMAAYFNKTIYVAPQYSALQAFSVSGAELGSRPVASAATGVGLLGATPSISASGDRNGIAWLVSSDLGGTLRAYDARDLKQLYDSNEQPADTISGFVEFGVPTIAQGKVYVGTLFSLEVFGLINRNPPAILGITDAASFDSDAISPGSLISIFGTGLSPVTVNAPQLPLPISLGDVSVTINGMAVPLLYVSPNQINAQVPFAIAAGHAVVSVRAGSGVSNAAVTNIRVSAPRLFKDERGYASALNADGTRSGPENPAAAGSVASVFFTGQGPVSLPQEDGAAPSGLVTASTSPISATIGGAPAEVQFTGLAPGYAGVAQMNVKIPVLPTGDYPLLISVAGATSNAAKLSVTAP